MDQSKTSKNILVAVCGGVAAYKALELVSSLRQQGHRVHVAMSDAAKQFVTPLSFSAVSGNAVISDAFPSGEESDLEKTYPHLYPATAADAFILVPATANKIAQIAQGLGTDVVSTSALSLPDSCIRLICPAMNVEMWGNEALQENLLLLEARGWHRVGPEPGHLACGMQGFGRLSSPPTILNALDQLITIQGRLSGKKVLILSGPTHEHIDPVRYIGNPSSGRMGLALAESAIHAGASVEFISGPVDKAHLPKHEQIKVCNITSADEMLKAAQDVSASADLVLFVAAVADYSPVNSKTDKLPKSDQDLKLELKPTPDIAATLAAQKSPKQSFIGFALQSSKGIDEAKTKLKKKKLDAIVLNHVEAMGSEGASYHWITGPSDSEVTDWGAMTKKSCADKIIEQAANDLATKQSNQHAKT